MTRFGIVALVCIAVLCSSSSALAGNTPENTPDGMVDECRSRAVSIFGAQYERVQATYEGERTDGTHAVNGSVDVRGPETFQCSYQPGGWEYTFHINTPSSAARADGSPAAMVEKCRGRISAIFGVAFDQVEASYQGERTDGTHAVNGSIPSRANETFQCSYARGGQRIEYVIVNFPAR